MTVITENKTFEERLKDRIKDSIGDLIADDDLQKLVNTGVQDVFFKPTKVKINSWEFKDGPSLLHSIVKELLEQKVKDSIDDYIKNNNDEVQKVITAALQEGVGVCVFKAMNSIVEKKLWEFHSAVSNELQQRLGRSQLLQRKTESTQRRSPFHLPDGSIKI
jgi:hypothetical protein